MVHTINDKRTAGELEDSDDATVIVSVAAFDSFEVEVCDGVVICTSDGCSFIGRIADVEDEDVLIELS